MDKFTLYNDDCLNVLRTMENNSIDSCVTDPPYGIAFMGKDWDNFSTSKNVALGKQSPANEKSKEFPKRGKPIGGWSEEDRLAAYNFEKWTEEWSAEVLRVLKPGGFLLSFCSPRMYHRMTCGIEDAGFQIRDQIMWLYGSGFPKSHNISKAIDANVLYGKSNSKSLSQSEKNRPVVGTVSRVVSTGRTANQGETVHGVKANRERWHNHAIAEIPVTAAATEDAAQWEGWGTALKPAHEPIVVARKPFKQSVAKNVLEYGTGAINIDECRVEYSDDNPPIPQLAQGKTKVNSKKTMFDGQSMNKSNTPAVIGGNLNGRWPANVIHDGSNEVIHNFPNIEVNGSAARFFYCAKASKSDKDEGLEDFLAKKIVTWQTGNGASGKPSSMSANRDTEYKNIHPTVKPTDLMKYLCRLVTPKNGIVLDPFMGSGTTGKAAAQEGFKFIGIEMSKEYFEIAEARVKYAYDGKTVSLEDFFA